MFRVSCGVRRRNIRCGVCCEVCCQVCCGVCWAFGLASPWRGGGDSAGPRLGEGTGGADRATPRAPRSRSSDRARSRGAPANRTPSTRSRSRVRRSPADRAPIAPRCPPQLAHLRSDRALDRTLGRGTAAIGEVALSGEVRPTRQLLQRASEAVRRGCSALLVPASQAADLASLAGKADIVGVANVAQAIDQLGAVPGSATQGSPRSSAKRS